MNFWTGDTVELNSRSKNVGLPSDVYLPRSPYLSAVLIRCYIEQLPEEQRVVSLARWDKLPFTPVRFSPPVLKTSLAQQADRTPVPFRVHFDDAYFAQHHVPIPTFKAMQFFQKTKYDLHELPRSNVLTITGKSHHEGQTTIDYLCTYPTTQEDVSSSLKPFGGMLRITPDLPEGGQDTMPEDLYQALQFFVHPEMVPYKRNGYG